MLKYMRKNSSSVWIKVTFLIIVVVFIFWGVGGMVRGSKRDVVASVNGRDISPQQLQQAYNNLKANYRRMAPQGLTPQLLKALNLKQRALDELIQATLLRQEAERLGLTATDEEVRQAIETIPTFQQAGGFNREIYLRLLRLNNLTPGDFEESQREDLLIRKLRDLVLAGVHVSDDEVHRQFAYDNQKVALHFLRLRADDFMSQVQISDDDLAKYYDQHKEQFREPERARIELATYTPADFTKDAKVDDAAVEQYYKDHASEFETPEQVHAEHILFKVPAGSDAATVKQKREEAAKVLARAKAGEDFAALAKEFSEDEATKAKGGDLGFFGRNQMVKPFEDAAFSLSPGKVSDLVRTQFGFHIIKVLEKKAAQPEPLDQVRGRIVEKLSEEKADALRKQKAEADQEKVQGGADLAEVTKKSGAAFTTVGPFSRADAIPGVGREQELISRIFSTGQGQVGPVVDTPKASYVFRVVEKISSNIPALSEIHDRVLETARKEKAEKLAHDRAAALLQKLRKAPDIDALAKSESLIVGDTGPFNRKDALVPGLGEAPADLKADAVALTKEHPVADKVYDVNGDSVIVTLKERLPLDEADFAAQKDSLRKQIQEKRKQEVLGKFIDELKAEATINVEPDSLARIRETA